MKRNENGDFCVLYVEPTDEKTTLIEAIGERKKPVVILLAEEAHVFRQLEDFKELKHATQQLDIPIIFIIANNGDLAEMATRNGFPVYSSMEMLVDAVASGQLSRHRSWIRMITTLETEKPVVAAEPKKTVPLQTIEDDDTVLTKTAPLYAVSASGKVALHSERPSGSVAPSYAERPSGNLTPSYAERPSGSVAPSYAERPSGSVAPSYAERPSGSVAPSYAERPSGNLTPSYAERPSGKMAPSYAGPPLGNLAPFVSAPPTLSGELPLGDLPSAMEPSQERRKRPTRILKILAVLSIIALTLVSIGTLLVSYRPLPATSAAGGGAAAAVGRVAFLSSEQISENSNQGLNDQVLVDLRGLPNPARQKSYYAWLLGNKEQSDMKTIFLGNLPVDRGNARLLYPGDQQHTNLLVSSSRLLVTEEDATRSPIAPSPDYNTWRYYGEISQVPINTPGNTNHLSFLAHLRHLLASDPTMDEMELPGGLNTWFYRNTNKIVEWMNSMREPWEERKDVGFVRRQTTRALIYLDGISFATQDLAANPSLINNERLARIGLIEVKGPNQDPPGYLTHLVHHLNGLLQTPGATLEMRKTIAAIVVALNDIQFWLARLRQDALAIMKMSDDQLRQPATLSLINDMISNARNAFVGQVDPVDGQMRQGVNWIHTQMQQLAAFNVAPFVADQQSIQWIKDTKRTAARFNLERGVL